MALRVVAPNQVVAVLVDGNLTHRDSPILIKGIATAGILPIHPVDTRGLFKVVGEYTLNHPGFKALDGSSVWVAELQK